MTNYSLQNDLHLNQLIAFWQKLDYLEQVVILFEENPHTIKGFKSAEESFQPLPPLAFNWDNISPEKQEIRRDNGSIKEWEAVFDHFHIDLLIRLNTPDEKKIFSGFVLNEGKDTELQLHSARLVSKIIEQRIENEFLDQSLHRALQQTEQLISELGALHEISRMFESSQNINVLLKYVLEKCMDLMNAESASAMMVVADGTELEFKIVLGPKSEEVKPFRLQIGKGIAGWVAQNNKPVLIPDAYQDPRFDPSFDKRSGYRTRSMLCVPLTYKSKPLGVMTILNRLDGNPFTESDQNLLMIFASQAALAIENSSLFQSALEKERMDKELQVAAEIQQLILPQEIPAIPGLDISATYIPCKEVSGDYYDIIRINDNEYIFIVADVSGKGFPGAMLVSTMQATLKAYLEYSSDLLSIITNLNERIIKNTTDDRFITFFFGKYNIAESSFTYINAGHNPPILVVDGKEFKYLKKGGIFIGCMPWKYEIEKIDLPRGSVLAMYTDGLVEAMNERKREFGENRFKRLLIKYHKAPMSQLQEKILSNIRKHVGDAKLDDDFTLILLKKE